MFTYLRSKIYRVLILSLSCSITIAASSRKEPIHKIAIHKNNLHSQRFQNIKRPLLSKEHSDTNKKIQEINSNMNNILDLMEKQYRIGKKQLFLHTLPHIVSNFTVAAGSWIIADKIKKDQEKLVRNFRNKFLIKYYSKIKLQFNYYIDTVLLNVSDGRKKSESSLVKNFIDKISNFYPEQFEKLDHWKSHSFKIGLEMIGENDTSLYKLIEDYQEFFKSNEKTYTRKQLIETKEVFNDQIDTILEKIKNYSVYESIIEIDLTKIHEDYMRKDSDKKISAETLKATFAPHVSKLDLDDFDRFIGVNPEENKINPDDFEHLFSGLNFSNETSRDGIDSQDYLSDHIYISQDKSFESLALNFLAECHQRAGNVDKYLVGSLNSAKFISYSVGGLALIQGLYMVGLNVSH